MLLIEYSLCSKQAGIDEAQHHGHHEDPAGENDTGRDHPFIPYDGRIQSGVLEHPTLGTTLHHSRTVATGSGTRLRWASTTMLPATISKKADALSG